MSDKSSNILHFKIRHEWRSWLEDHFTSEREACLVYPNKSSGETGILYNDAVEEALCFGWIDSIYKKLDEGHTMQRFTPRKAGSSFSQPNKERLMWLHRQNLIHPSVQTDIEDLFG